MSTGYLNNIDRELIKERTLQLLAQVTSPSDENSELEVAAEAATGLIEMGGFDLNDSDAAGMEMGEVVHGLLTVALVLCPQLRARIQHTDPDVRIIAEEV